ncbi:MAG: hydroxysqualene dehydroxylase HpnE [Alphaproteobacteria bacterium]
MTTVHIVGAGLAGLASAVRLTERGVRVALYEGAGHAGGRCRSFHDDALGCLVDNGNHLLLSGNRSAMSFLRAIGSEDSLIGPVEPEFAFVDLATDERWTVRPNRGRIPWWIFAASRRVPMTRARDYLGALRLGCVRADATIAACFEPRSAAFKRFWEPLAVAVLNAGAEEAAASLLWPVMVEIFGRGGDAARPLIAKDGLSQSFVEPALRFLERAGATIRFNQRLRAIDRDGERLTTLDFGRTRIPLAASDRVILAVPPPAAHDLLPDLAVPTEFRAIVNAHYRLPHAVAPASPFIGLVNATAHWLFVRGTIVSVTVSAADSLVDEPAGAIAARLWADVARTLRLPRDPMPPYRIVKEKRATFAQIPATLARRAKPQTRWRNLVLAGDWTDTGLPATIEGAIRSGQRAAELTASP